MARSLSSIDSMVAELERRYKELKESQIVGSDAVKTFMTKPIAPFSQFIANNVMIEVIVTFTPDDISGKTTAGAYALKFQANQSNVYVQRMPVIDFTQQKWRMSIQGLAATASVDFWVFSTGKGTVSFTVLP